MHLTLVVPVKYGKHGWYPEYFKIWRAVTTVPRPNTKSKTLAALLNNAYGSKTRDSFTQGQVTVKVLINNDQAFLCWMSCDYSSSCMHWLFLLRHLSLSNTASVPNDIRSVTIIRLIHKHGSTNWKLQIIQFLWVFTVKSVVKENNNNLPKGNTVTISSHILLLITTLKKVRFKYCTSTVKYMQNKNP